MQQRSRLNMESASGSSRKANRRVALAPHKEEIRGWVCEGCSDSWIASALGTTPSSVQSFRSRHGIHRRAALQREASRTKSSRPEASEPETAGSEVADPESVEREASRHAGDPAQSVSFYEGVLEHGEQIGYGLWLDPAVADDPVFQRGFAGVSDVRVSVEDARIVLTPVSRDATADSGGVAVEEVEQLQPGLTDFAEAANPVPASNREYGTLKWFAAEKGFGFIIRESGEEIFVHKSQLGTDAELAQGEDLSYEVSSNERGLVAVDVRASG